MHAVFLLHGAHTHVLCLVFGSASSATARKRQYDSTVYTVHRKYRTGKRYISIIRYKVLMYSYVRFGETFSFYCRLRYRYSIKFK